METKPAFKMEEKAIDDLLLSLFKNFWTINHPMEMIALEEDRKHFEFLVNNSKEIFEKEVYSDRQQNVYKRIIIGFTLVYFPFFLVSLGGLNQMLHFIYIL